MSTLELKRNQACVIIATRSTNAKHCIYAFDARLHNIAVQNASAETGLLVETGVIF